MSVNDKTDEVTHQNVEYKKNDAEMIYQTDEKYVMTEKIILNMIPLILP
jgi:hypothetical protein